MALDVDIPALHNPADVADWLGLTLQELRWFADVRNLERRRRAGPRRHYRYATTPKPGGELRLIEIPKPRLKAIQRRVLRDLLDPIPVHPAAHGFVRGRCTVTHAREHTGCALVLSMDLHDFFASTPDARVFGLFRAVGLSDDVARTLTGVCTNAVPGDAWPRSPPPPTTAELRRRWIRKRLYAKPHLPAGAPTSPALANLGARRLDVRLAAAADAADATYTRYADDLTFSGGECFRRRASSFFDLVCRIVAEEGFTVAARKTKFLARCRRQRVTGLVVNDRVNVSRRDRKRLEATLFNCVRHGPRTQNRADIPDFRAHLRGRIAHLSEVDPCRGAKLLALFEQIDWSASS